MCKITVVIPTYNRKQYLEECINSVLSQSFQDFKILVFDSGSSYDIGSLILSFGDNRISLISSDILLTSPKNYSRIYNYKYESEYLIIFHDDDAMHPKLLEILSNELDRNNELVFVGSDMKFIKNNEQMSVFSNVKKYSVDLCENSLSFVKLLLNGFNFCYGSVMYRTKFLPIASLENIYIKYSKWNDRPILIELSKKGPVSVVKAKLVNYRMHMAQDSQQGNEKNDLAYMNNLFQVYKDNCCFDGNSKNKKIFLKFSTNNSMSIAGNFASNFIDYFRNLWKFRQDGFFKIYYVRLNGLYYFLKFTYNQLKSLLF